MGHDVSRLKKQTSSYKGLTASLRGGRQALVQDMGLVNQGAAVASLLVIYNACRRMVAFKGEVRLNSHCAASSIYMFLF